MKRHQRALATRERVHGELIRRLPLPRPGSEVKLDIRAQAKGVYHVELGDGRQRYTGTIVFE